MAKFMDPTWTNNDDSHRARLHQDTDEVDRTSQQRKTRNETTTLGN